MKSLQTLSTLSTRSLRAATRTIRTQSVIRPLSTITRIQHTPSRTPTRSFSSQPYLRISIIPESSDPAPPKTEASSGVSQSPADLSDAEYHEISDQYMNSLVLTLEEVADKEAEKGLEVEYSAGVLTIAHPSKGTYVLNKQPPNKQIWLSSPESGPKRFDWVLRQSGGMDSKQDTEGSVGELGDDGTHGGGKWTYLRDGSTLSDILKTELDVVVAHEGESDATPGREGPGGSGVGGGVAAAGGVEG